MQTIVTQKFFVFRNDKTGEICSVPRSPAITQAKHVPDWVPDTDLFKLALKDGSVTVVEVKTPANVAPANVAKVGKPVADQVGVAEALASDAQAEEDGIQPKAKGKK